LVLDPALVRTYGAAFSGKYPSGVAETQYGRSAMANKITHDDIDHQFYDLLKDPERFLQLTNQLVEQHPDDPHAYFARHKPGRISVCQSSRLTISTRL
jgi:hypothetical protein